MKGKLAIFILLAIIGICNFSTFFLDIDNTPDSYLVKSSDVYKLTKYIRKNYSNDEIIFIAFTDNQKLSTDLLTKINSFASILEERETILHARSLFNVDNITADAEGFKISPILTIDELNNSQIDDITKKLNKSKMFTNFLYSKDHSSFAVIIETKELAGSIKRLEEYKAINKIIDDLDLRKYYRAMAGPLSIDVSEFEMMLKDMSTVIPVTAIMGFILIFVYFPCFLVTFTTMLCIGASVAFAMSLFVVFNVPFNLIGTMIPSLLSALAIAFLLHLYNSISKRLHLGEELKVAAINGAKDINLPSLYSALTTATGLAALATCEILPTRYFGVFSAAGVILIYIICIYFIPHILTLFPTRYWKSSKGPKKLINNLIFFFLRLSIRWHKAILPLTLLFPLCLLPFVLNIKVESNLLEFFQHDHKIVKSTNYIQKHFLGLNALDMIIRDKGNTSLLFPNILKELQRFEQFALSKKEIDKTSSILDFIRDMHWAFNSENEAYRVLPDNKDLIEQYLFVYDGNDLFDFTNRDFTEFRMTFALNAHGANESSKIVDELKNFINQKMPKSLSFHFAGEASLISYQENVLVDGQFKSLLTSLLIIFFLMVVLWRSFSQSIICMIPNISPIISVFALMGIFNIWLDMGTSMIASVSVGIAVDDTIHIFHSFRKYIRAGNGPIYALAKTFDHSGRAIINTTFVLCMQFIILLLSDFVPTGNFGALTATGLITALIYDIVLLPSLLYYLAKVNFTKRIFI